MKLELDLQLGQLSLAQGLLDVAIAFVLFVVLRLANMWWSRRCWARDERKRADEDARKWREHEEREYERRVTRVTRRRKRSRA